MKSSSRFSGLKLIALAWEQHMTVSNQKKSYRNWVGNTSSTINWRRILGVVDNVSSMEKQMRKKIITCVRALNYSETNTKTDSSIKWFRLMSTRSKQTKMEKIVSKFCIWAITFIVRRILSGCILRPSRCSLLLLRWLYLFFLPKGRCSINQMTRDKFRSGYNSFWRSCFCSMIHLASFCLTWSLMANYMRSYNHSKSRVSSVSYSSFGFSSCTRLHHKTTSSKSKTACSSFLSSSYAPWSPSIL